MMKRIRVMRLLYFDAMKVQIYYDIPAKETPMLTYNLSILQRKRGICLGQCNGDYWLVASVLLVTVVVLVERHLLPPKSEQNSVECNDQPIGRRLTVRQCLEAREMAGL